MTLSELTRFAKVTVVLVAVALGLSFKPKLALAEDKAAVEACFAAHEKSQVLRLESKLLETRDVLRTCSDSVCPSLIRADCVSWLAETQRAIPSIIFQAEEDGEDVVDVRVQKDKGLLLSKLDGRAIEFDPGAHIFRFEFKKFEPKNSTVVLREGEKNRVVRVEFSSKKAPLPGQPGFNFMLNAPKEPNRPVPLLTYVFGGAAIVAGGVSGTFMFLAGQKYDSVKKECNDRCTDDQVAPVESKQKLGTYVGIGAGVAAAAALVFYIIRPVVEEEPDKTKPGTKDKKLEKATLPVDILVSPNSAYVSYGGAF